MMGEGPELWTVEAVVAATGGRLQGSARDPIGGISIDSRTVAPGDAFFAIRGDRFDGHDFIGAALDAGAGLAVAASDRAGDIDVSKGPVLIVDDVLVALERLGQRARGRMNGPVIAITGSVGKTGTKEALRLALEPSGSVHAAVKSFNNHWGVPLSLARMPEATTFGIFEIGMNHAGEIRPLVKMVRPHIAIITTVEAVHIEYFESVADIARAKAEIFEGVEPGGTVLLNADNMHYDLLCDLARRQPAIERIASFGEKPGTDVRLVEATTADRYSDVTADVFGQTVRYRLGAPGQHLVLNSLAVIGAASLAGADVDAAGAALAGLSAPRGRGERRDLIIDGGAGVLIDESYNANPASMRAALDLLGSTAPSAGGRRIAILGDMLELGATGEAEHARLAEAIEANAVDRVACCGPLMRALWEKLPAHRRAHYAPNSEALSEAVLDDVRVGDVVMVKGSLGSRMGPLVESLLTRYGADKSARDMA
ncbi:MAG: UDP-N-acetylmuramoylalanyl-D-glutamyl-2,6-diaminopimelate--D-alanyl-D-alanine ligase [Pseudomonadota bacterium]